MARRSTGARLVGRDQELADLVAAVRSEDRERSVVLVSGEAGIGKSRLLAELTQALREDAQGVEPFTVVRGSCLRLADGELPFAPIIEVLGALRSGPAADQIEQVQASLSGSGPEAAQSPEARMFRFLQIHEALAAAAAGARLVVIVDDLHWADRSTLDLLLFLARRIRGTSVVLLAAYRSDELHRRHPLRPVIAELSRGFVRERIELMPLDRNAVLEQIAGLGGSTDSDDLEAIVERADGNPFFVEELVALGPGGSTLPATLRDVLLARIASLDQPELQVLGATAVLGCSVDVELLDAVVDLSSNAIISSVGTAVDSAILKPEGDGQSYRFRHALLEEAVYDDLLPAQRVELHRRAATVLRSRRDAGMMVAPGELAWHLDHAGDRQAAVEAHIATAEAAFRATAWAEGIKAFERASELSAARAGLPGSPAGFPSVEVVIQAARAMNWLGSGGRSISVLRDAIGRAGAGADTDAQAELLLALARIQNEIGDEAGWRETSRRLFALPRPTAGTPIAVDLLIGRSFEAWNECRYRDALSLAEAAVAGAEELSDPRLSFSALIHRAEVNIGLGNIEVGRADVERARELQAAHGWLDVAGNLSTNIAQMFTEFGDMASSIALWQEGVEIGARLGITGAWDPWQLAGLAGALFLAGRWSEVDTPLARARSYQVPGIAGYIAESVAVSLAAGRGDLGACDAALLKAETYAVGLPGDMPALLKLLRAERARAAGAAGERLAQAQAALGECQGLESPFIWSRCAEEVASAAADLAEQLRAKRDAAGRAEAVQLAIAAADVATAVDEGRHIPETRPTPLTSANAFLARAEARRAVGTDDAGEWDL